MADSPIARPHGRRSPCRARTCPQATNRVDLDPAVRDVWGLPVGRVTYSPHAHDVACAHHWAPRLEAVIARGRRARHVVGHVAGHAGHDRARTSHPISRHWMGTARMGDDAALVGVRPVATAVGRRQRAGHRFVGVPDVDRLRPDADARRARGACRTRAGGLDVTRSFADVDALFAALDASRHADDEDGLSILEHSLQCAELLRVSHPDDPGLQVAGLVHDLGWLERVGASWRLRPDAAHDVIGRALVREIARAHRVGRSRRWARRRQALPARHRRVVRVAALAAQ